MRLGKRGYGFMRNRQALRLASAGAQDILLTREAYIVDRYLRYRPLVYYVVHGPDYQFELLRVSIESLLLQGQYQGDIAVITDRADISRFIPKSFTGQLHTVVTARGAKENYSICRFEIASLPGVEVYQPILYLDTDVACENPLDILLGRVVLSQKICVGVEDHPWAPMTPALYDLSKSVGKLFFEREGTLPRERHGFNSGIMGFRNVEVVRQAFAMIQALVMRTIGEKNFIGNQGASNYVIQKLMMADVTAFSDLIRIGIQDQIYAYRDAHPTPVLVHFWGVPRDERRITVMRRHAKLPPGP